MITVLPQCNLRHLYTDANGHGHLASDCGPCYTIEWAPSPDGPWYFDRNGVVGQDIVIEPTGTVRYYRSVPRECEKREYSEP